MCRDLCWLEAVPEPNHYIARRWQAGKLRFWKIPWGRNTRSLGRILAEHARLLHMTKHKSEARRVAKQVNAILKKAAAESFAAHHTIDVRDMGALK